jgi:hypothetical protein
MQTATVREYRKASGVTVLALVPDQFNSSAARKHNVLTRMSTEPALQGKNLPSDRQSLCQKTATCVL